MEKHPFLGKGSKKREKYGLLPNGVVGGGGGGGGGGVCPLGNFSYLIPFFSGSISLMHFIKREKIETPGSV